VKDTANQPRGQQCNLTKPLAAGKSLSAVALPGAGLASLFSRTGLSALWPCESRANRAQLQHSDSKKSATAVPVDYNNLSLTTN